MNFVLITPKWKASIYIVRDYEGNEIVSGKIVDGKMTATRPTELGKASSSALRLNK